MAAYVVDVICNDMTRVLLTLSGVRVMLVPVVALAADANFLSPALGTTCHILLRFWTSFFWSIKYVGAFFPTKCHFANFSSHVIKFCGCAGAAFTAESPLLAACVEFRAQDHAIELISALIHLLLGL